jgi:RHS repeat-associated protein
LLLYEPGTPDSALASVTPAPRDVAGFHAGGDVTNSLGRLDLSAVPNGAYDLKLIVHGGGSQATAAARFILDSQLKIGQFGFSEQDLVLPVNGIPLTVTRTYNSLNPRSADFGYSWTYSLFGMDVQLHDERMNVTIGSDEVPFADDDEPGDNGLPKVVSIRTGGGWDVTLTLPDGRRTTFAFDPHYIPADWQAEARWKAPPGVTEKLEPLGQAVIGFPYNQPPVWEGAGYPSTFDNHDLQVWVLTTLDDTKYYLRRGAGNRLLWDDSGTGEGHWIYVTTYDATPKLTEIVQRTGDRIQIKPNGIFHYAAGPNGSTTEDQTRSVLFERDLQGRITAIRDPNSGSNGLPAVKYVYHAQTGNLLQVLKLVDRTAGTYTTTSYRYDNPNFPHYITEIVSPNGVPVVRNLYDDSGRLVGIIDSSGRTNRFEHDIAGRREIQFDRSGQQTIYQYDTRGNVLSITDPLGHTNGFTYDDNGYPLTASDGLGNTTHYTNDANGNVLSIVMPHPVGADPTNYTTHFTYNQFGDRTSVRLPSGAVITNEFDANGNLTAVKDELGNVISSTAYNSLGLPVTESDRFGSLSYGYDSAGNLTHMTNGLNQVVTSGYDLNGNLTNLVNNGVTMSAAYDAMNRETAADYGHGITVNYEHDGQGDWSTVSGPTVGSMERHQDDQGRVSGWTTANGSSSGFGYDVNGRLEYETNAVGVATRTVYDAAGRVIAVTNLATGAGSTFGYDAANRRVAATNALDGFTLFGYYPDGSLATMTNALGTNVWTYDYATGGACCGDGSTATTVTDPYGRQMTELHSAHGLPISTIWRSGSLVRSNYVEYLNGMVSEEQEAEDYPVAITDEGNRTRRYEYTEDGQLYRATDLSGSTWWTNQFDADTGALTNVLSPTGETLGYTYDDLDNVATIRFGDGNWLTNFYSAENRLSGLRLPSGTLLTNFFDFAGRLTNRQAKVSGVVTETASFEYNGHDAVTRMTDDTGSTTNLFDAAGRLWGIDYPSGASVRYQLDLLDRISAVTNKASAGGTAYVTRYQRDVVGNVTNVIDPFNGNTSFEYDRVGRRTKCTLPNGIVTEWQYNWRDQVTNITHKTSGGTTLASVLYERATGGEPTKLTREDGTYVELKYDASFRLTNEVYYSSGGTPQTTNGYGYDASGSRVRLVKGGTTLTNSVSAGYRITAVKDAANGNTVESYAYDNGGRVTTITRDSATLNLGYNSADQVTAVTNGASWVTYRHDANGRRTVSTNSAGTVRRLLVAPTPGTDLESPHLIANAGGTVQQGYVYLGDEPLLRYTTSGTAGYYLEDGMGSVIGIAPATSPGTGNTTRLFYDGFGNSRATNGPAPTIPTGAGGDFRFHGAWLEEGSGLYNMRAREYDPRLGRFTSRDPDGESTETPEGLHPYNYADCNPYVYSDPTGEFTMVEINVVTFLQFTLQTLRGVAVNEAKYWAIGKIGETFGGALLRHMDGVFPGFDWARFEQYLNGDRLGTGTAFDRGVKAAMCLALGGRDGVGDKIHMDVRVVNKGTRLGQPISAGNHCGTGRQLFEPNTPVLGQRRGARYSIPDFIIGQAPLVPPGGRAGTRKTYFVAEVKSLGSTLYSDYVSPGRKKRQLQAILGYSVRNTETRLAFFIVAQRYRKGNALDVGRFYVAKRIVGFHALSHGVIPVLVKVR